MKKWFYFGGMMSLQKLKFLLPFVFLSGLINGLAAHDYKPYVSPGITFGWNMDYGFTFTPKVSLGVFDSDNGLYFSITYGFNSGPIGANKNINFQNYNFLEAGAGKIGAFSGGALGIAFYKSHNEVQYAPKLALYMGLIVFVNMDLVLTKGGPNMNIGLQPNLPIPLKDPHFSLGG